METTSDTEYRAENDGVVTAPRPPPIDTASPNIDGFHSADAEAEEVIIEHSKKGTCWDQLFAFILPLYFVSFCLDPTGVSDWKPVDWIFIACGVLAAFTLAYRIRFQIRANQDIISRRRILCAHCIACADVQEVYVDHKKTLMGYHGDIPYHAEHVRVYLLMNDGSVFIPLFGHDASEFRDFLVFLDKQFPQSIQHGTADDGNLPDWAAAKQITCSLREVFLKAKQRAALFATPILLGVFLLLVIVPLLIWRVVRILSQMEDSD